jgi:hypothetical protein
MVLPPLAGAVQVIVAVVSVNEAMDTATSVGALGSTGIKAPLPSAEESEVSIELDEVTLALTYAPLTSSNGSADSVAIGISTELLSILGTNPLGELYSPSY